MRPHMFPHVQTMVEMGDDNNGFAYDFATIVYRWQLLGFNAIRLPFRWAVMRVGTSWFLLLTFNDISMSLTWAMVGAGSKASTPGLLDRV